MRLLLQGTQAQLPALTWWLRAICNSSSRDRYHTLIASQGYYIHMAQYTAGKALLHINIHKALTLLNHTALIWEWFLFLFFGHVLSSCFLRLLFVFLFILIRTQSLVEPNLSPQNFSKLCSAVCRVSNKPGRILSVSELGTACDSHTVAQASSQSLVSF